jgi:hypothetical protein
LGAAGADTSPELDRRPEKPTRLITCIALAAVVLFGANLLTAFARTHDREQAMLLASLGAGGGMVLPAASSLCHGPVTGSLDRHGLLALLANH